MDIHTALATLDSVRAEIEESGTVPPLAARMLQSLAFRAEVHAAWKSGRALPAPKRPARRLCVHAEDTGEKFNPGKPCMGRKIICRNEACDMRGQAWPSSKCTPERCKHFHAAGTEPDTKGMDG